MLRLFERTIASLDQRLMLLAPNAAVPAFFRHVSFDPSRYRTLLRDMQKLRGDVYYEDGALRREELTPDGLHETAEDEKSWHLLMVDSQRNVTGCAWYLQHDTAVRVEDLRIRRSPLSRTPASRRHLWKSVEAELARARRECLRYAEVGGWAVSKNSRCTSEGLILALAGYSLGRICGGCLGITTATIRHCSSAILRRLGGASLEADGTPVPTYYDPRYRCEMELLRFDSRHPDPKFGTIIERLRERMATVQVIARPSAARVLDLTNAGFYRPGTWNSGQRPAIAF